MYIPEIPNNGLKTQLEELVCIARKAANESEKIRLKFEFNPPATDEEINVLEKTLNFSLPLGYREFLLFSNGAQLCGQTAEFENINSVIDMNKTKITLGFPSKYIVIASFIGDGELLCFSKETGGFIRWFDGNETYFDTFYDLFEMIIKRIKSKVEDYIDL